MAEIEDTLECVRNEGRITAIFTYAFTQSFAMETEVCLFSSCSTFPYSLKRSNMAWSYPMSSITINASMKSVSYYRLHATLVILKFNANVQAKVRHLSRIQIVEIINNNEIAFFKTHIQFCRQ